jgi:L-ascorbate metabolism protein UlaG (beta-lactamase superfamily)
MKLTKYAHACIVLEEQGKKLVIDPGVFTPELGPLDNIVAVVVTHDHPDHFNPEHLQAIFSANPDAQFFTTEEVASKFTHGNTHIAKDGNTAASGPFSLQFSGEIHQLIHSMFPRPQNTAVTVNGVFFYPGDSFTKPPVPVSLLAVPANAPWTDIAHTIDYIGEVRAQRCIPTHNGLLSEAGHKIYNGGLGAACENAGTEFIYLQPGESLDV